MIAKRIRTTAAVKSDYERKATQYDPMRFASIGGQHVDFMEKKFVAGIVNGSSVLEVGTATGRFAVSLANRGAEYTGVDLSKRMLKTTFERTNRHVTLIQMDGCELGFRKYFDYVLCIRTFHFLPKPIEALQGTLTSLEDGGQCLVTFETDNHLRRLLLFLRVGTSEQYYYKVSDVEKMFCKAGFRVVKTGSVMRMPVTLYRRCPRLLLPILKRTERVWPWSMHDYVLGLK